MTQNVTEDAGFDMTKMPAERLLTMVGGIVAIAFGGLALVLYIMAEDVPQLSNGYGTLGSAIFSFSVALVFGLALLLAAGRMVTRPAEGGILALAFSVVLLAFGALPGLIAGIVGLVGALTAIVRNLKFGS